MYVDHSAALEMCGLERLHERREHITLKFAPKCTKHKINSDMFPPNPSTDTHNMRNREPFQVSNALTEGYTMSAIPYLQRKLNSQYAKLEEEKRLAKKEKQLA